jgi:hypothetical protein
MMQRQIQWGFLGAVNTLENQLSSLGLIRDVASFWGT